MNILHLKYFIALAKRSNYREAAAYCNVSQPAISMAIKSFEEKLGKPLFLRQKSPVTLTDFGKTILAHAEKIVFEYDQLINIANRQAADSGNLRLGIIPTIAPYLLPKFIGAFTDKFPNVNLEIEEVTTDQLIRKINQDELDAGIIATPVEGMNLLFDPLFYEEFMVYTSEPSTKNYILPSDIDLEKLWLLQEGHCLRTQVINLCELKKRKNAAVQYNAGTIETLINLVDNFDGVTVIPELASRGFSKKRKERLQLFHAPAPVREVSIAYHRYAVQIPLIQSLGKLIQGKVPPYMREREDVIKMGI